MTRIDDLLGSLLVRTPLIGSTRGEHIASGSAGQRIGQRDAAGILYDESLGGLADPQRQGMAPSLPALEKLV
jgi:hypothetical protein